MDFRSYTHTRRHEAQPAQPPADRQAGNIARTPPGLSYVDGEASFWRPGAQDWAPAQLNTPLAPDDELYTGNRGNLDYSIPHTLIRRPLTLIASDTAVRLVDGATEVARHARSYDQGQRLEDPAHLAALAREKRRAYELRGRDRLRQSCPRAEAFLDALALRGEPLAPQTLALLRLLDQYGAAALDGALAEAVSRGAINAASVAHLLDQLARARHMPPPLAVVLPDDPRVRDLRVTPHRLTTYDALLQPPSPPPPEVRDDPTD